MNLSAFFILIHALIIAGSLLSIVYTFGVVWRVEKKLDTSYKFLLAAIITFASSEVLSLFGFQKEEWEIILSLALKALFVILFLMGILETRTMIRKMDGEMK